MTANGSGRSFRNLPKAEETLSEALRSIAEEIKALNLSGIRAVVLGGGYGRGEGGALDDGSLCNDLDFFVIRTPFANAEDIAEKLAPVSGKWREKLGIDVDFSHPVTLRNLRANRSTLMIRELLSGHEVVFGDKTILDSVPRIPWTDLPVSEAARLLLNRGTGILLSMNGKETEEFIRRNLCKAVLGCGDALLIGLHRYRRTGMERAEELGRIPDLPGNLAELYAQSLAAKYNPGVSPRYDIQAVLELYLESLRRFAGMSKDSDALAAAEKIKNSAGSASPHEAARGLIRNLLHIRELPYVFPLFAYPRLKLLPMLVRALSEPGNEILTEKYLGLWRKFN